MKRLFIIALFAFLFMAMLPVSAQKDYLEAKNYANLSIQDFLNQCKLQNKNAYFNKGLYSISEDLHVVDGVDLIGEEGTIFQSLDKQRYIYDLVDVKNIRIEHIIFDNISIWCQREKSTGWIIAQNIFLNARDLDVTMGCKPDSYGKNGGPATGYYIQNKRGSMQILSNLFLRDAASLGRGVATYYTKDVLIKDNYFGRLEDVEKSIVSEQTKHLKEVAISSKLVDTSKDYGYFMTGINILNSDENAKIIGNYLSFNTHITEAGYEDGSQSTKGYNRDHFVYAKAFLNLEIVGNYFKGMNKNQDGGVKCRNGDGLLIYKNVLEDSLILLYVQNDATKAILKNVEIRENIFINKDYTQRLIKIPYGNQQQLSKYLTVDYSILFMNYRADSNVDSITIDSNLFYSIGLANEQIRLDNRDKTYQIPTNIFIENNKNILGKTSRVTTRNFQGQENVDAYADWNNGTKYSAIIPNEYKDIDVSLLASLSEIVYQIQNGKLITSAEKVYVDGKSYEGQTLIAGQTYFLFLASPTTSSILVEEKVEEGIESFTYTTLKITVLEQSYTVSFDLMGHGTPISAVKDVVTLPNSLPTPSIEGWMFKGWYIDEFFTKVAVAGSQIAKDTTLYAKWEPIVLQINFVMDKELFTQKVSYGSQMTRPENPMKEGYIFGGWYLDEEYKEAYDFTHRVLESFTLYAKWQEIVYTVTFAQTDIEPVKVKKNEGISRPQDPVKAGYEFKGWYKDITGDILWDFENDKITNDITLYPKWEQIPVISYYTVCFMSDGKMLSSISQIPSGSKLTKPEDLVKDGYLFLGWYQSEDANEAWDFTKDEVNKDLTLYARWEQIPNTADSSNAGIIWIASILGGLGVLGVCIFTTLKIKKKKLKQE